MLFNRRSKGSAGPLVLSKKLNCVWHLRPLDTFSRLLVGPKCTCSWGSAPNPAGRAYSTPPDPLAGGKWPLLKKPPRSWPSASNFDPLGVPPRVLWAIKIAANGSASLNSLKSTALLLTEPQNMKSIADIWKDQAYNAKKTTKILANFKNIYNYQYLCHCLYNSFITSSTTAAWVLKDMKDMTPALRDVKDTTITNRCERHDNNGCERHDNLFVKTKFINLTKYPAYTSITATH